MLKWQHIAPTAPVTIESYPIDFMFVFFFIFNVFFFLVIRLLWKEDHKYISVQIKSKPIADGLIQEMEERY